MPNTLLDRTTGIETLSVQTVPSNIYQNTNCAVLKYNAEKLQIQNENNGVDDLDATDTLSVDTNPFTNNAGSSSTSSVNPFSCYLEPLEEPETGGGGKVEGEQYFQEGSLVKGKRRDINISSSGPLRPTAAHRPLIP